MTGKSNRRSAAQDLNQGDQFQAASENVSAILGKLPNAAIRTHYIRHSAGLLSQGDTRMAMQLEEALRNQCARAALAWAIAKMATPQQTLPCVKRQRLNSSEFTSTARDSRFDVKDALRQRDVEFSLSHHRFVWREILRIEEEESVIPPELHTETHPELAQLPDDFDLTIAIQDLCTDYPEETQLILSIAPPE